MVANSQELFSSSTTELGPPSSERSSCQKETPYQEKLTAEQNPQDLTKADERTWLRKKQERRTIKPFLQRMGGNKTTGGVNPYMQARPNSGQPPDGGNMSLSRWATMKGTQSECRREEQQGQEGGITWDISMETQILGVACEIPIDPGPSRKTFQSSCSLTFCSSIHGAIDHPLVL